VVARLGARRTLAFGETVELVIDCDAMHLFDRESEQRLPGRPPG
jgi:hypothetical protein